jgi:DNA-binding GntR family transcriptional regulator
MYEVRFALEPLAAAHAATRATELELDEIERSVISMRTAATGVRSEDYRAVALESAMFGAYGSSPTRLRLRRFYQRLLLAGDADLRGDLPAETTATGTPLALTGIELHRYGGFADRDGAPRSCRRRAVRR